jgi:hypothetical protein
MDEINYEGLIPFTFTENGCPGFANPQCAEILERGGIIKITRSEVQPIRVSPPRRPWRKWFAPKASRAI